MPSAGAVFDALDAQPRVRDFLRRAAEEDRLGQAYLLVGPTGAGQEEAARAIAQAAVCVERGCGACEDCRRAAAGTHPDVRWEEPGSATGYLVGQVRALIDEAPLAPVRGRAKAFVLNRADRLREASANALLKTLEEPPAAVAFVLIAPSVDAVLPTIASRCQVVPFSAPDPGAAARSLAAQTGASEADAARALAVTDGPGAAATFLSPEGAGRRAACAAMTDALLNLRRLDGWGVVVAARAITEALAEEAAPSHLVPAVSALIDRARMAKKVKPGRAKSLASAWEKAAAGDGADPVLCQELTTLIAENGAGLSPQEIDDAEELLARASRAGAEADYLTAGAAKEREKAAKRATSARERSSIMETVACAESLLRDLLAQLVGAEPEPVAARQEAALGPLAAELTAASPDAPAAVLAALDACARARADVRSNVTPRVALEALLLSVKEALWLSSSR